MAISPDHIPVQSYPDVPLKPDERSIRFLRLRDGGSNPWIFDGQFEVYPITTVPSFVALSYTWGPDETIGCIRLNGHVWKLRANVYRALRTIWSRGARARDGKGHCQALGLQDDQGRDTDPLVWIDSLCINQNDVEERNHQVGVMDLIYSKARTVVVWLGEEDSDSITAMDYINDSHSVIAKQRMERDQLRAELPTESDDDNQEQISNLDAVQYKERRSIFEGPLRGLLSREYWERMWVVQEFLLGKSLLLFAGHRSCHWQELQRLHRDEVLIFTMTPGHKMIASKVEFESESESESNMQRPVLIAPGFSRFMTGRFYRMMERWSEQRCRDPRDMVYGLLGLLETDSLQLTADYSKAPEDLYAQVMALLRDYIRGVENAVAFAIRLQKVLQVDPKHPKVVEAFSYTLRTHISKSLPIYQDFKIGGTLAKGGGQPENGMQLKMVDLKELFLEELFELRSASINPQNVQPMPELRPLDLGASLQN